MGSSTICGSNGAEFQRAIQNFDRETGPRIDTLARVAGDGVAGLVGGIDAKKGHALAIVISEPSEKDCKTLT